MSISPQLITNHCQLNPKSSLIARHRKTSQRCIYKIMVRQYRYIITLVRTSPQFLKIYNYITREGSIAMHYNPLRAILILIQYY